MTADPFADGMPAGDDHHWERARSADCPHCPCCTEALCDKAIDLEGACHHFGTGSGYDLSQCPCWLKNSAARKAKEVAR
jgi:hypothetical protein